ncbi:MAG: hypothetical protein K0Q66_742 [Chitinophagaceae bacterium]|jgi:hypothetical protein|nr:hypothetical protein [Chitinophagaceae bacterium]
MKKILCLAVFSFIIGNAAFSQNTGSSYTTALGAKFYPGAITIKHFTKPNRALEGLGYFWQHGFRFTGLYEIHGDFTGAPGLKWYIGPGAHIQVWNDEWKKAYPTRDGGVGLGIDGVLGLDYKIKGAPINLSLDWQPSFNFVGYNYFQGDWGGFAVRYTF